MTFTTKVKEEIAQSKLNEIENRYLLLGYLFVNANWNNENLSINLENASVAKKLYLTLKYCYNKIPKITVRMQKKFKVKKIYILEVKDDKEVIKYELNNLMFEDEESLNSFIKGIFLSSGSISDPKKSQYHLELTISNKTVCEKTLKLLKEYDLNFKMLKREKNYMLYLKSGEEISDFLRVIDTENSLFYYEDIRIYRDHKNMVNRLNNCEQANLEKSLKTSTKQTETIKYLKENNYFSLLDEKTRQVAEYRLKYPEESFQTMATIISKEIDKKVSKSYINHHFRKINEFYNRIILKENIKKEDK